MADQTLEEYRAAQQREYATYKAILPIFHDGARAYNVGDPVPISNVETHSYEVGVQVERVGDAPAAGQQNTTEQQGPQTVHVDGVPVEPANVVPVEPTQES